MSERISIPRYIKIAVDVATRIYKGNISEGEKLRGRSILASEYNVSPETIRKAMKVLEDRDVVRVSKGSGIIVLSKYKAGEVIQSFRNSEETISGLRQNLKNLMDQKKEIDKRIHETMEKIIDLYKFKRSEIIDPIQIQLKEEYHIIGKTIGECKIWENTGATILGVLRNGNMILSPGPNLEFKVDDSLIIVGDLGVIDKINEYLQIV
ncbi:TrkA C-terminal domain-containing protein [Tepidibacter aestuarii]|uniref:TrkA C-terminal domain-containing protein n=1 Tax=Tepidibacter aestuarii TaxID=2925782 RepID=UPI0020C0CACD|nr:TrkA C-terminal domain-containing protein [Tepidibacter aestuarii]CAH2212552.1 Transcriptional regulator, GntR family [Tepidibacter aestuarii]